MLKPTPPASSQPMTAFVENPAPETPHTTSEPEAHPGTEPRGGSVNGRQRTSWELEEAPPPAILSQHPTVLSDIGDLEEGNSEAEIDSPTPPEGTPPRNSAKQRWLDQVNDITVRCHHWAELDGTAPNASWRTHLILHLEEKWRKIPLTSGKSMQKWINRVTKKAEDGTQLLEELIRSSKKQRWALAARENWVLELVCLWSSVLTELVGCLKVLITEKSRLLKAATRWR